MRGSAPTPGLALLYGWMACIETLGFLVPFVFDDPLVALPAAPTMLVPCALALRRYERPWLR